MPWLTKRLCLHPGCKGAYLGKGGYCPTHLPLHNADKTYNAQSRDMDRQRFESSATWRKIRHAYLARHPLCQDCKATGRVTQAAQVHHIDNDYKHNTDDNLQGLCASCHAIRTRTEHVFIHKTTIVRATIDHVGIEPSAFGILYE
jgi:5-methylcytosine-specific restriction protein A